MNDNLRNLPHLFPAPTADKEGYTSPNTARSPGTTPRADRSGHARTLRQQIEGALSVLKNLSDKDAEAAANGGLYLEFRLQNADGVGKALDSLETSRGSNPIELLTVLTDGQELVATVFLPDSQQAHFAKRVNEYETQDTPKGNAKNANLVDRIDSIAVAGLESVLTSGPLPQPQASVWWEAWLRKDALGEFVAVARRQQLALVDELIRFPERDVVLVHGTPEQMERLLQISSSIAELRVYKETPSTFLELYSSEQQEWVEDLVQRTRSENSSGIFVCVMDCGVHQAHPLLQPHLQLGHCHTVYAGGTGGHIDRSRPQTGHGTAMAGLALYGDLTEVLQSTEQVVISHALESVKFIPDTGFNPPRLFGAKTIEGVSAAEVDNPDAVRVVSMAITCHGVNLQGHPTSWSAALDQLAFGQDETDIQRLIVVSAGNVRQRPLQRPHYFVQNDLEGIEDPAQAWNVLTVGAYTLKSVVEDPSFAGHTVLAPVGGLSPGSLTSVLWEDEWPVKPDVVLEGGNAVCTPSGDVDFPNDLGLLTTHDIVPTNHFRSFGDTSAATALASRMAAQILAFYPTLRPETVRALMVHSADWTTEMKKLISPPVSVAKKRALLRRFGYGVPSLERALFSAKNDLSLVIEDTLRPFRLDGSEIKTDELNLHKFPWPKGLLEQYGDKDVELRVTLSYFIEPNPGERGWNQRHSYRSHGLRFEVKGELESLDAFRKRINKAARATGEEADSAGRGDWMFGSKERRGSVFSDVWKGTASALASKDAIAVFPVGGWWRTRKKLQRFGRTVRYSMVVSIKAPDVDIDIYQPVAQELGLDVQVLTPVTVSTST